MRIRREPCTTPAADGGDYANYIAELLTREQLAEAQRRARAWFESSRSP